MAKVKGTGVSRPYKVRVSWEDTKSQVASYSVLENAKLIVDELTSKGLTGYKVFMDGEIIYEPVVEEDSSNEAAEDCIGNLSGGIEDDGIEEVDSTQYESNDESSDTIVESETPKKKGFFARLFGKK